MTKQNHQPKSVQLAIIASLSWAGKSAGNNFPLPFRWLRWHLYAAILQQGTYTEIYTP
jgi:hypothetical protein